MVGKKGFLKIVEATIAVLIIISALLILSARKAQPETNKDLNSLLPPLLDEIARRAELRAEIVYNYNTSLPYNVKPNNQTILDIENYLKPQITNPGLNFTVRICALEQVCILEPYPVENPENIFAAERVVTTTLENPNLEPKKLKIFLWRIE